MEISGKRAFIYGVAATTAVVGLGFAVKAAKRRSLEKRLSAELYTLLSSKAAAVEGWDRTEQEAREWADYSAYELVLHGYRSLAEYGKAEAEIDALVARLSPPPPPPPPPAPPALPSPEELQRQANETAKQTSQPPQTQMVDLDDKKNDVNTEILGL